MPSILAASPDSSLYALLRETFEKNDYLTKMISADSQKESLQPTELLLENTSTESANSIMASIPVAQPPLTRSDIQLQPSDESFDTAAQFDVEPFVMGEAKGRAFPRSIRVTVTLPEDESYVPEHHNALAALEIPHDYDQYYSYEPHGFDSDLESGTTKILFVAKRKVSDVEEEDTYRDVAQSPQYTDLSKYQGIIEAGLAKLRSPELQLLVQQMNDKTSQIDITKIITFRENNL